MSILTEVGNAARRARLLEELERQEWNLTRVTEALRLGKNTSPLHRLIRTLDLTKEYEEAQKQGRVQYGGSSQVKP